MFRLKTTAQLQKHTSCPGVPVLVCGLMSEMKVTQKVKIKANRVSNFFYSILIWQLKKKGKNWTLSCPYTVSICTTYLYWKDFQMQLLGGVSCQNTTATSDDDGQSTPRMEESVQFYFFIGPLQCMVNFDMITENG